MNLSSVEPVFGENYCPGYIGFTYYDDSVISRGIAYFERWDRGQSYATPVTHAFIVTDENECVEAHARSGVASRDLRDYFNDPHCQVYFRKPRGYILGLGYQIRESAFWYVGDTYNYGLIFAELLANSFLGRCLNSVTFDIPNRLIAGILGRSHSEICSELVAKVLQEQPTLCDLGVLRKPADVINPQMLFGDRELFEDWK